MQRCCAVLWVLSIQREVAPSLLIKALCLFVSLFFLHFLSQLISLSFMGDKHRCAVGAVLGEQRQAD